MFLGVITCATSSQEPCRFQQTKAPSVAGLARSIKFTTAVILDPIMSATSQFELSQGFLTLIPTQSVPHRAEEGSLNVLDPDCQIVSPLMITPLSNNPESLKSTVRITPTHAPTLNDLLTVTAADTTLGICFRATGGESRDFL